MVLSPRGIWPTQPAQETSIALCGCSCMHEHLRLLMLQAAVGCTASLHMVMPPSRALQANTKQPGRCRRAAARGMLGVMAASLLHARCTPLLVLPDLARSSSPRSRSGQPSRDRSWGDGGAAAAMHTATGWSPSSGRAEER